MDQNKQGQRAVNHTRGERSRQASGQRAPKRHGRGQQAVKLTAEGKRYDAARARERRPQMDRPERPAFSTAQERQSVQKQMKQAASSQVKKQTQPAQKTQYTKPKQQRRQPQQGGDTTQALVNPSNKQASQNKQVQGKPSSQQRGVTKINRNEQPAQSAQKTQANTPGHGASEAATKRKTRVQKRALLHTKPAAMETTEDIMRATLRLESHIFREIAEISQITLGLDLPGELDEFEE